MIADGKTIARALEEKVGAYLAEQPTKRLCFVVVGNDPSTEQFVGMKVRTAKRIGVETVLKTYPADVTQEALLAGIDETVAGGCDGIVVQLPLPAHINTEEILDRVPADLDVDVLGKFAKDAFRSGDETMIPPVARGVWEILKYYQIELSDKKIIIIGAGKLVGEPVAQLLKNKGFDFSVIDHETPDDEKTQMIGSADVIISGAGVPHMIKPDIVKDGVVLIDAGTSESAGRVVGDIDPVCADKAYLMTPTPGGVGPVTVACLFMNLIK